MTAYLQAHPGVAHDMTLMVRQLDPTPTGLPLEVYCFSSNVDWVPYENLAGDIFDHLLAVMPEFGLRVFQQPSGAELSSALANLRIAPAAQDAAPAADDCARDGPCLPAPGQQPRPGTEQIGRAACRERVCQYLLITVVAVSLKKK